MKCLSLTILTNSQTLQISSVTKESKIRFVEHAACGHRLLPGIREKKRSFGEPLKKECLYIVGIVTKEKRLKLEILGIIVLGMWLHLSNIEISTVKALEFLIYLEVYFEEYPMFIALVAILEGS